MSSNTEISTLFETVTDWWLRHDLFDPAGVFCNPAIFIESYAIRGALRRLQWLESQPGRRPEPSAANPSSAERRERTDGLPVDAFVRYDLGAASEEQRLLAGAAAFCDRVVAHQGVQGPPEALMMGYGQKIRDGLPEHACVADQSSIAVAVLETFAHSPGHPNASGWLSAIERWAAWVLSEFARPDGAIGVGIYGHRWNPLPEYWCATGLATEALLQLARLTGKREYRDAGLRGLDWLSRFDFTSVEIPRFADCAPEVILYSSEGLVEGIRFLKHTQGVEAARGHAACSQFASMAELLAQQQSSDGRWSEPPDRGYRDYSAGIPWVLLAMDALVGPNQAWQECARRFLACLATREGERYFGMYVRQFTMGLAWISTAAWCERTVPD